MNHYVLEKIAYGRIAEDEQAALRERLALEADRARAEARQAEGSLFAGFLRTLLGVFGTGGPALESTVSARHR
jgi:hypothetical protein